VCICTCAYTYMLVWKNVCTDRAKLAGWCMQYLTNSLTSKAVRCVYVWVCGCVFVRVCVVCARVYTRVILFCSSSLCLAHAPHSFLFASLARSLALSPALSLSLHSSLWQLAYFSLSLHFCVRALSLYFWSFSLSFSISLRIYLHATCTH